MQSRRKIYCLLAVLSVAGYAWIIFQLLNTQFHEKGLTLCLFKNVTGFPCPSCGITRSLLMLISGNILEAFMITPLGLIVAIALLITPLWMITDGLMRRDSLAVFFLRAEQTFKTQKSFYLPGVALILINWGWSIMKGL